MKKIPISESLPTKITIKANGVGRFRKWNIRRKERRRKKNTHIHTHANGKIVNWLFVVLLQQLKFPHQMRVDLFDENRKWKSDAANGNKNVLWIQWGNWLRD